MQNIYGFGLLWLGFLVVFIVLMLLEIRFSSQEEEPEEDAADEPVIPDYDFYRVRMDYTANLTLGQRIESLKTNGKCKCKSVNNCITEEHYPITQAGVSGKIKIFLVPLNKEVKDAGLLQHLDKFGLRLGRIEELLEVGKVFPEIQRKSVLIAFGSVWEQSSEDRLVPYLEFEGALYDIYLDKDQKILANESHENWYVIAVPKD